MAAEVFFRGPILFLDIDSRQNVALLPDAERVLISDNGARRAHPDGTRTKSHHAGLIIADDDDVLVRIGLRKKLVVISDEDGGICSYPVKGLVPIDAMANTVLNPPMTLLSPADPNYWTRVTTRVSFNGGVLSDWKLTDAPFRLPPGFANAQPIPVGPKWTPRGATRIDITSIDGTGHISLHPRSNQQVYLFNWDDPTPKVPGLKNLPHVKKGSVEREDGDFKWLYELYDVPGGQFSASLPPGTHLPAPMSFWMKDPASPLLSVGSAGCVGGGGHG